MNNHTKNLTGGLFWTFLERMGNQGVNLIISIILATHFLIEMLVVEKLADFLGQAVTSLKARGHI